MTFAPDTTVSVASSRAEIEHILERYGADQFLYGWDDTNAIIRFRMNGRHIHFVLPLPDRNDPSFSRTPKKGMRRTPEAAAKAWEQAQRSRWRALCLVIKAKLEAVESGITVFEDEFLAHIVLPDGSTMGAWARPQIQHAYENGAMPSMLPQLGAGS